MHWQNVVGNFTNPKLNIVLMEDNESIFSNLNANETEASASQRFGTSLVDLGVNFLILIAIYQIVPLEILVRLTGVSSFLAFITIMLLLISFRLIFLLLFTKTIGMMICKVKFLNADLQPLSVKEKLLSAFRRRNSQIKYYKIN